jgi:MFS family permease
MLLRAMFAGSVVLTLMAFSRNVVDLTVLRLMQGAFTGTIAAAIALVATETPRDKVGWAMGVLSSAIAMGTAIGPFVGGITATAFGLRPTFAGGGILLLLSTIPVIAMVRDSRRAKGDDPIGSAIQLIRARPGALRAIAIIVVAQGLLQFGFSASQQLVVVRLLALIPTQVTSVTGIAFGTSGLFSALAAVTYAKIAHRFGYRPTVVGAACCLAGTMVAMAIAPAAALVVAAIATFGLLFGALSPAMSTMLGLEAPRAVQARVFGISASALAVGIALGPLSCGALASMTSPQIGLLLAASSAVVLAVLMGTQGREPAR